MKKFKTTPTIISLLVTLLVAGVGTLIRFLGNDTFAALQKPSFQPPDIVFPIVWGVLYLLTFLSAALYFSDAGYDKKGLALFISMGVLNVLWVVAVFLFGLSAAGVAIILAYIVVVILTINHVRKVVPASAWLLVPHLLWLLFALVLNYMLALLN